MEPMFVGIDVAKDRPDANMRPSDEPFAVARGGKGLEDLTARLRAAGAPLTVLEASGGFEVTVAAALCAAGPPLAAVNPRQIRDFDRATGRLGNDAQPPPVYRSAGSWSSNPPDDALIDIDSWTSHLPPLMPCSPSSASRTPLARPPCGDPAANEIRDTSSDLGAVGTLVA